MYRKKKEFFASKLRFWSIDCKENLSKFSVKNTFCIYTLTLNSKQSLFIFCTKVTPWHDYN